MPNFQAISFLRKLDTNIKIPTQKKKNAKLLLPSKDPEMKNFNSPRMFHSFVR